MTKRTSFASLLREDLNFLLTNRIPRRLLTRFMGWFSRIEQPLVRDLSIALWRRFSDLDLSDARKARFTSVHDCFTRELREGARRVDADPDVIVSPCDGIVGACGQIEGDVLLQIKGLPYRLEDLMGEAELVERHRNGVYATLRLTPTMYHRFHAPHDCRVERVTHISGDTWNVNPVAVQRIEKLFCRNERAVVETHLTATGQALTLVPVAAILVAGIRLHCFAGMSAPRRRGREVRPCAAVYRKGEEMGWFEHGSTIIVLGPHGLSLTGSLQPGAIIRQGQSLMRLPKA